LNTARRAWRYWETLRHLKPIQFSARLKLRFRPRLRPLSEIPVLRAQGGSWQPPAPRAPSMTGPEHFRFLNREHRLPQAGGWDDPALEKLWLYNLHYFDDLNAAGAEGRVAWHRALMTRWITENLPTSGNGWEPYPTSLRIANWAKWMLAGNTLTADSAASLALQARWLRSRLEWHLLGNHLFANAKALLLAGLLFERREADGWRDTALSIISEQLPEQILSDGGNFERSPMYHALFLEDLLDIVNAAASFPGLVPDRALAAWRETASRMLAWLQGMVHPDGEISLFNDAAIGIAPSPDALGAYASRLGIAPLPVVAPRFRYWADSGYIRLQSRDAVALLDVAPVGPDYLPGHAHADTLSFELSVFEQRVVVNGGTSRYGTGAERERERGTAAHSTVEVGGENSSDVWAGFRVGRRARPQNLKFSNENNSLFVTCAHDGYDQAPFHVRHRRSWTLDEGRLTVRDALQGSPAPAVARFIFHPQVTVAAMEENCWRLSLSDGRALRVTVATGRASIVETRYAPAFGITQPAGCLAVEMTQGEAVTTFEWDTQV
jgi:uncharacterized heparinase superfamily protein